MFNKLKSVLVVFMLIFISGCIYVDAGICLPPVIAPDPEPNPGLAETEVIPVGTVYNISTMEELVWIANKSVTDNFTGKTVRFMQDIDMGYYQFSGIIYFAGKLEGNNKTISNLIIGDGADSFIGLVNVLEDGGHIENLTIANGRIYGNSSVGSFVGYLRGKGTIVGVTNNAEVRGKTVASSGDTSIGFVGGLVGLVGFIGTESNLTVTDSLNTGNVFGVSSVGGLIGSSSILSVSSIKNSSNVGMIQGNSFVGGLVGIGFDTLTIDNSSNSGTVKAYGIAFRIGGLVGSYDGSSTLKIDNSFNSGTVEGLGDVGGVVGGADGGTTMTISNVHSYATKVNGEALTTGGLVGAIYDDSTLTATNSYWLYDVTAGTSGIDKAVGDGGTSIKITLTGSNALDILTFKDTTNVADNFIGWDFTPVTGIWEIKTDAKYPTLINLPVAKP